jgi:hypothetical protein
MWDTWSWISTFFTFVDLLLEFRQGMKEILVVDVVF